MRSVRKKYDNMELPDLVRALERLQGNEDAAFSEFWNNPTAEKKQEIEQIRAEREIVRMLIQVYGVS